MSRILSWEGGKCNSNQLTALSVKDNQGVFGGGTEELAKSGASPSLPAWGAERTPAAWMAQKRMSVNLILAVSCGQGESDQRID